MKLKYFLLIGALLFVMLAYGQNKKQERLLLYNPTIVKHSYIPSGKIIKLKDLAGNKYKGKYTPINDSTLSIGQDTLLLSQIQRIHVVYTGTVGSQIGGVLLMPLGTAGLILGGGFAVAAVLVTEWLFIPAAIAGVIGGVFMVKGIRNLKKKGKSRYTYDRSEWEYSIKLAAEGS